MSSNDRLEGAAVEGYVYPVAPPNGLLVTGELMRNHPYACGVEGRAVVRYDIPHDIWVFGPKAAPQEEEA